MYFFSHLNLAHKAIKKPFLLHKHGKLTTPSFREEYISSALCNIIFGTLVARD
jgi:hypothetical protein